MYKIPANTLFIGQNQVFVPQCHSTNSLAAELVRNKDLTEGTTIITDHQISGRGQRGNTWQAEPGKNLTFSVVIKPSFLMAKDQFYLTMVVSLALHEFITSRMSADVKIKWPNDILVKDKKICGILIENIITGDVIQHSIIGIGLNVNQISFPMDTPTSMTLIADQEFDLGDELNGLLEKLESFYLKLRSGKFDLLKQEYLNRMYWMNESHTFRTNGEEFEGLITGVNENGRLTVLRDGKEILFDLKDISFVK